MPVIEKHREPFWGTWKIEESSDELFEMLERKEIYRPYIETFSLESRRQEWLAVRVLLKELLGEEVEVLYLPNGKPYLIDNSFQLSITHTKGYVALILDKTHRVGIDMEVISPRIKKIRRRFMSDEEESHISSAEEDIHLLLHWSAKECMYKALGDVSVEFKECLHIQPFNPELNLLSSFPAYETKTERKQNFLIYYMVYPDYLFTFTRLEI